MIKYFLFDLDNTIYPSSSGVMQRLGGKIHSFIMEELDLPEADAKALRKRYLKSYGTTLLGLRKHHDIDAEYYITYVHQFPLDDLLKPNQKLDEMLSEITVSKSIFTNSPREHAENVLSALQLGHHFENIFDIRWFNLEGKPELDAYYKVTEELGVAPAECVLFDDSVANIKAANDVGMTTVYVSEGENHGDADFHISSLDQLQDVINALPV